jgi:hypothetical protein
MTSRSHVHASTTSGERNAHEEFRESIWEVPFAFNQYFSIVDCGDRIFVLLAFLCLQSARAGRKEMIVRCIRSPLALVVLLLSTVALFAQDTPVGPKPQPMPDK